MNAKKQEDDIDIQKLSLLIEEWKTVIQTQMHLNDMLMKMRTAAISMVVAVFSAAAVVIGQFPDSYLRILGKETHISILIIIFGIALWLGIFAIDYGYYYKMLLGAVKRGYEFDEAFEDTKIYENMTPFGLSSRIRDKIGKPGASKYFLFAFYGVVLVVAVLYIVFVYVTL